MADLADVLDKIRDEAAAALSAAGLVQPNTQSKGIRIYRGWPGEKLDTDLVAGIANVTVYPRAGVANVMDGSIEGWKENPRPPPGMTATTLGAEVTFAGTADRPGLIAAVVADRRGWTLALTQGQTPENVAANFQTAIAADRPAEVAGAVLSLPGAGQVRAGVYASGTEWREVRRQEQGVLLTVWAPTPALRDKLAAILDLHFAGESGRLAFLMPDGSTATVRYAGTVFDDAGQLHPLYRRDLALLAEYSIIRTRELPPVAAVEVGYTTIPPGAEPKAVF